MFPRATGRLLRSAEIIDLLKCFIIGWEIDFQCKFFFSCHQVAVAMP